MNDKLNNMEAQMSNLQRDINQKKDEEKVSAFS